MVVLTSWWQIRQPTIPPPLPAATFGLELTVDQEWAKVYQTSPTGYIGLVDGEPGMRDATAEKAVTVSFFTDDIRGWFDYARDEQAFELRSEAVSEADDRFLAFVGYDPEGYFLEFDTFLEHEANTELLEMLGRSREPRWDDLAALARAAD